MQAAQLQAQELELSGLEAIGQSKTQLFEQQPFSDHHPFAGIEQSVAGERNWRVMARTVGRMTGLRQMMADAALAEDEAVASDDPQSEAGRCCYYRRQQLEAKSAELELLSQDLERRKIRFVSFKTKCAAGKVSAALLKRGVSLIAQTSALCWLK